MPADNTMGCMEQLQARLQTLEAENEQLRLKAASFDALAGNMDEGLCVLELLEDESGQYYDYRHVLANEACVRHTQHPKHLGLTARETIPDEVDSWLPHFAEVARSGQSVRFVERLAVSDRWLNLSVHRLEPACSKRVLVIFTGTPGEQMAVDQLQALNKELAQKVGRAQANSKLLGELVDHSVANVFAADRTFRLLAINRTAQETFMRWRGVVPKVGEHIPRFLAHQPDIISRLKLLWPRILAGESFVDTVAIGQPDAQRYYEVRYNPLRDADNAIQGGFLFAYDITERVAEQARLRQVEETLRHSQKLEAVGQLTGGISHDFNNLLGSITGALEIAAQRQDEGRYPDASRLIGLARQDTQRAAALVQRLLTFARQQTLMPQPVDVHQLVVGMHDLIKSSLHANIDFEDSTCPGQWLISIDPPQLENALLNLCINARDAMPLGGRLSIRSTNTAVDALQAQRLHLPAGDYVQIRVSDSGIGMPNEVLERAMEPFFTTKPLGQGSGLGLSMVYGFIRQSGGQMNIKSVVGSGTCIDIYLPKDNEATLAMAVAPVPAQPLCPAPTHLIMLVEDEHTLRLVIEELLDHQGHTVYTYSSGRDALAALQGGLQPALLITDIGLPGGVDGKQLAMAMPGDAAVLYITGYTSEQVNLPPSQRAAILCKPFALTALSEQVRLLLADRRPISGRH
nr:PAS domain-containing sensor histidine kinase [Pseudomonas parafulva]